MLKAGAWVWYWVTGRVKVTGRVSVTVTVTVMVTVRIKGVHRAG